MAVSVIIDALLSLIRDIFANVQPLFVPFVPYWIVILTALSLSPLTVIIPQLLQGKLTWPSTKDVPDVWTIHGRRYNLRPFYEQHPGGSYALRAARSSDCTGLFESCHTFIDREVLLRMLARFEIEDGIEASKPIMIYSDPFYEDLKAMAREYFKGKGKGAHKMTSTHQCISFAALGLYWILIYQMVHGRMWCMPFVGFLSWYLTGNMMHDANHGALVSRPWLNQLLAHGAFPYGVNVAGWTIQHVMSHHIYTNSEEHDVDLYHFDPVMPLKKGEGTVHIALHYVRLFYLLSSSIPHLVLVVPYGLICGQVDPGHGHAMYDRVKSILAHRAELRGRMVLEVVAQFAFWAYCGCTLGVIRGLCLNMMVFTISSFLFSFFTQVSHLQDQCFLDSRDLDQLSFAKRQVVSSIDFSPDSLFWGHVSGGLNTQAIHHCFPSISAMHLRGMYPGFRRVCRKHGVELKEAPSLQSFVMGFVHFAN